MADASSPAALERIDRAITRIEKAASDRDLGLASLSVRHAALRQAISGAIAALDAATAKAAGE